MVLGGYGLCIPIIRDLADRALVHTLTKQLRRYGHAEFTTDAATYRPAHKCIAQRRQP
jgi:hypothetical protein